MDAPARLLAPLLLLCAQQLRGTRRTGMTITTNWTA
ncbi:GABRD isoform 5 [Pan troglodytes]|uniref:Gamma-aminobutyric acid type A receptor subunit delta n=2 Tax=Homininae TaxID=207598 RepID=A0A1W2PQZ5_HUMAN|nr:GABRD isoform 5 [Pan troglodytes]